ADLMSRFNDARRADLQRISAQQLDNQSYGGDESDGSAVRYASKRWMTWAGGGGGYYGGAHPLWAWTVVTYDLSTGKQVDATDLFRSALPQGADNKKDVVVDMKAAPNTLEALVLRRAHAVAAEPNRTASGASSVDADCFEDWLGRLADCEVDDKDRPSACTLRTQEWHGRVEVPGMVPMLTDTGLAIVSNDTSEAARACRGVMITIPWGEARRVLAPGTRLP
ncbi:MAG TPA: hypothetical protein VJN68_05340, partial [Burkholderiaceae bacterium]|nr:hypothetical protein [Burkholderiaceae bacterium]